MAIVQISKIQVRSGNIADLPQLAVGEFGWATDTQQLFIGNDPNTIGPLPDNTEIMTEYNGINPGGGDGDIQYNNGGRFGGSARNRWDNATGTQTIIGNLVANTAIATGGFFQNSSEILTGNYLIAYPYNALTAGPITLSGDANITVEPGVRWIVV